MHKGLRILLSLVCLAFAVAALACSGPAAAPANRGNAAENGTAVILVENTSISLSIRPLKPDRVEMAGDANWDRLVDFIRVTLGNVLEGNGQKADLR
jgi:hypothetical protein